MKQPNSKPLRLAIVDDEPIARSRLRRLIGQINTPRSRIVLECGTAEALAVRAATISLDAVFIDIEMPGRSGLSAVELWSGPRPEFVFVTAHHEHALRAFDLAAADYLTKPVSELRLTQTLHRLWDLRREGSAGSQDEVVPTAARLTSRQTEILTSLIDGHSNKEIARALGLSHFTVRNHVTGLFRRFGVSRRSELANAAGLSGVLAAGPGYVPTAIASSHPHSGHLRQG